MTAPSVPVMLDTAIPMYAAGTPHPYRDACQWLMSEIAVGRMQVVIDAEIIRLQPPLRAFLNSAHYPE